MSKENETNHWDTIAEQQLDQELAKWAAEEIEVPAGFHAAVMQRLREEASLTSCDTDERKVVSLSNKKLDKKANKKWWTPAVAAAALMLCCLPVLQQLPHNLPTENSAPVEQYSLAKSRIADGSGGGGGSEANTNGAMTADNSIMMAAAMDTSAVATMAYDAETATEEVVSLEQQLLDAKAQAEALELQLSQLRQENALETQMDDLEYELQTVYDEIAKLEAQLKEE